MNTRTNIILDDDLVAEAMERAGVKTKKAAVEAALRAYVRKPDYGALLGLEGSRLVADDYDPKSAAPPPAGPSKAARAAVKPAVSAPSRSLHPGSKRRQR